MDMTEFFGEVKEHYGSSFVAALGTVLGVSSVSGIWQVGKAKDQLSRILELVREGNPQLIGRGRTEEPVVICSLSQLASIVEAATPQLLFADLIQPDSSLPSPSTRLRVDERSTGEEHIHLGSVTDAPISTQHASPRR